MIYGSPEEEEPVTYGKSSGRHSTSFQVIHDHSAEHQGSYGDSPEVFHYNDHGAQEIFDSPVFESIYSDGFHSEDTHSDSIETESFPYFESFNNDFGSVKSGDVFEDPNDDSIYSVEDHSQSDFGALHYLSIVED